MKRNVTWLLALVFLAGTLVFNFAHAASSLDALSPLNPACAPAGCTAFGGRITFFGTVPDCGLVVTTGLPNILSAVYTPQTYLFNPPLPTDPPTPGGTPPGTQWALGIANNFNPNPLCPLPIVVIMGVSSPLSL